MNRIKKRRLIEAPKFRRQWSLASADTMSCPPIGEWAKFYLSKSVVSIDPFARNCRLATLRNDLNPETGAEYHLDALDFLRLMKAKGFLFDLAIFDPPFSRNQVKQVYQKIGRHYGRHYGRREAQEHTANWQAERDALDAIMLPGGLVLSFGWNSSGMTVARGYSLEDVLLVCHGGAANDTICIAERKNPAPAELPL